MNYFRLLWNLYQQKQHTKKSVYDSFISGEYLGWNAKNLTLINTTLAFDPEKPKLSAGKMNRNWHVYKNRGMQIWN